MLIGVKSANCDKESIKELKRINEAEYNSGIQGAGVLYIAKSTILILLDRSTCNKKSAGDRYVA